VTGFLVSQHLGSGSGRSRATARTSYCYYSYCLRIYRPTSSSRLSCYRDFVTPILFSLSSFFHPNERDMPFSGRKFHQWRSKYIARITFTFASSCTSLILYIRIFKLSLKELHLYVIPSFIKYFVNMLLK
jgi:hypothetical protein